MAPPEYWIRVYPFRPLLRPPRNTIVRNMNQSTRDPTTAPEQTLDQASCAVPVSNCHVERSHHNISLGDEKHTSTGLS